MQAFPKRKLVIGSTVLAVAAFAGGAVAATQGSSNPRQQYLNDVAKRLNVTPAQLDSALKGAALDQLEAAVKAGELTQAQANALKQRVQQGAAGGAPFIGPPRPFGPRAFGPGPLGLGLGRAVFFGPNAPATAVAKYLGLTTAQLVKQLESGKSLAEIAKAQGKTTAGLDQAITAAAKTRLDKAVADKRITAAQEQQMLKACPPGSTTSSTTPRQRVRPARSASASPSAAARASSVCIARSSSDRTRRPRRPRSTSA